MSRKKKIIVISGASLLTIALVVLIAVIYVYSGYRTAKGTFGYSIRFNTREYEFVSSSNSIDMIQIRELEKAENDCYVYVGNYDTSQDLQETIDIVNETDGTDLKLMKTTVGSKDYPAVFVSFTPEEGGYAHMYYIDYLGKGYVISTLTDKQHEADIEKMLESFTIEE